MIYPGETIGIIGGEEKGLNLAVEAKKMGFKTAIYTGHSDDPALGVADFPFVASLKDNEKLQQFINLSKVIIYTIEVMDASAIQMLEQNGEVVPQRIEILNYTQDRYLEKLFFEELNINIAPYATVVTVDDVKREIEGIGYPAVIKPIQKGIGAHLQYVIHEESDIAAASELLSHGSYVLESWIPYERELSVIAVKSADQKIVTLPIIENQFKNHILMKSILPARIQSSVAAEVVRLARLVGEKIDYTGTYGLAFFLTSSGALYVKRLMVGPNNSGTILSDTLEFSQYAYLLRAVCGWAIPKPRMLSPGICMTILTEMVDAAYTQAQIKPDWHFQFCLPSLPRKNQRVGSVTLTGPDVGYLLDQAATTDIWQ